MEDNVPAGVGIANVVEDTTPQLGGTLDSNAHQISWSKGSDVASANALVLGTDGNYFDITGTTAITSIATLGIGTVVVLHFDGILTLTHQATDLILPGGANITTAAGDEAMFVEYATGDWRCVAYTKASGEAVVGAAVSDITYAPSWDGVTGVAPSKNAVYDVIELIWRAFGYKGYIMGGFVAANTAVIEDLIFSNETSQAIAATLDAAKRYGAGVNSASKGYIMGGAVNTNVIEDLIFSNEASQAIAATLDTAKQGGAGVNSISKGYIMGGYVAAYIAVIEDLIFSNETSQAIAATLDAAKRDGAGVNSASKGYIMGGAANTAVIEDLIFSNETSQAIAATLDTAKQGGAGVNSISKGYIMGGYVAANTAVIEDLIFSNETSQAITATLDAAKKSGAGVNSVSKGYIMGGIVASNTDVIEDLIFSNETSQAITATLDTAKYGSAGVQYGCV